jgi:hypothetical protein
MCADAHLGTAALMRGVVEVRPAVKCTAAAAAVDATAAAAALMLMQWRFNHPTLLGF